MSQEVLKNPELVQEFIEDNPTPNQITKTIATKLFTVYRASGLTMAELAKLLAESGWPWPNKKMSSGGISYLFRSYGLRCRSVKGGDHGRKQSARGRAPVANEIPAQVETHATPKAAEPTTVAYSVTVADLIIMVGRSTDLSAQAKGEVLEAMLKDRGVR